MVETAVATIPAIPTVFAAIGPSVRGAIFNVEVTVTPLKQVRVVSRTAIGFVMPFASDQGVRAVPALQDIVPITARQAVVSALTVQVIVARSAKQDIVTVICHHHVVARAAIQRFAIAGSEYRVVARQVIIACQGCSALQVTCLGIGNRFQSPRDCMTLSDFIFGSQC